MIGIDFFADFMVMGLRDYLLSPVLNNVGTMPVANSNNSTPYTLVLSHNNYSNLNNVFWGNSFKKFDIKAKIK